MRFYFTLAIDIAAVISFCSQRVLSTAKEPEKNKWPAQLLPKVLIFRQTSCEQPEPNSHFSNDIHQGIDQVHMEQCKSYPRKKNPGKKGIPLQYIYWQMPVESTTSEDHILDAVHCNITIFEGQKCTGKRILRTTIEGMNTCLPAHGGHSIRTECWDKKQMQMKNATSIAFGGGPVPPPFWRKAGALKYGEDGNTEQPLGSEAWPRDKWTERPKKDTWNFLTGIYLKGRNACGGKFGETALQFKWNKVVSWDWQPGDKLVDRCYLGGS